MLGRQEHELQTAQKIEDLLQNRPNYFKGYYKTLYSKSYTTQKVYLKTLEWFVDYLDKEFELDVTNVDSFKEVKPFMIDGYVETLQGLSSSSQRQRLHAVKSFFKYLYKNEYITSNPADMVDMPSDKDEHIITSLTKDEIDLIKDNILTNCGKNNKDIRWLYRDYTIVMMALSMAFRVASITEINLEDIDFEQREITIVQKGNQKKRFIFSNPMKQILLQWIEYRKCLVDEVGSDSSALFINTHGNRLTTRSIQKMTKKYTYNIDKNITPHKFRSTCATEMYRKTGDIYAVSKKLGHSNIQNTKRYIQIDRKMEERAASIMDDVLF